MRTLTSAEERVLLSLIGSGGERQSENLRRSGVSRSTFTSIRERALQEGWIYERAIPLAPAGTSRVVVALAHPFVESVDSLGAKWELEHSAVLLWQSAEVVLGVFLARDLVDPTRVVERLSKSAGSHDVSIWDVQVSPSTLPVFFDYEGVWAHLIGRPSEHYPRSLGDGRGKSARPAPSSGLQQNIGELIRRPYRSDMDDESLQRFGPSGFPRSMRRLIAKGYVDWRIFPDLARMPPFSAAELSRVAFIQGDLRPNSGPVALFQDLVGVARVFPFLYVIAGKRVLLAALGGRENAPPAEGRSLGVLETLQGHLEGIKVTNCDWQGLTVRLDHRYERLFSPLVTPEQ